MFTKFKYRTVFVKIFITVVFTAMVLSLLSWGGIGTPVPEGNSNTVADVPPSLEETPNPSDSAAETSNIFDNGWADATTMTAKTETINGKTILYSPTLFNTDTEEGTQNSNLWETVADITAQKLNSIQTNPSYNIVSAYNTPYHAKEIITQNNTTILTDILLEYGTPTTCNFTGQYIATGQGDENYTLPTPLKIINNNPAFLTDWDRDENYTETIKPTGFYTIFEGEILEQLVFVAHNVEWEELIFINITVNIDGSMFSATKHVLSSYILDDTQPGRALQGTEDLTRLVTELATQVEAKNINTVQKATEGSLGDDFWGTPQANKDYILKTFKKQDYTLQPKHYSNLDTETLTQINTTLTELNNLDQRLPVWVEEEQNLYDMLPKENGEGVLITFDGGETEYSCTSEPTE